MNNFNNISTNIYLNMNKGFVFLIFPKKKKKLISNFFKKIINFIFLIFIFFFFFEKEYQKEGIDWSSIQFNDNEACLSLFTKVFFFEFINNDRTIKLNNMK